MISYIHSFNLVWEQVRLCSEISVFFLKIRCYKGTCFVSAQIWIFYYLASELQFLKENLSPDFWPFKPNQNKTGV